MEARKEADRFRFIPEPVLRLALAIFNPLVRLLVRLHVRASYITTAGLLLNLTAALLVALGYFGWAGILLLVGGLCDWLDGSVARSSGTCSSQGWLFDNIADRLSDFALLVVLGCYFIQKDMVICALSAFIALWGGFSTSMLRMVGLVFKVEVCVGWLQRQHRVLLLATGLLLSGFLPLLEKYFEWPVALVISILAILANVTALQRLYSLIRSLH